MRKAIGLWLAGALLLIPRTSADGAVVAQEGIPVLHVSLIERSQGMLDGPRRVTLRLDGVPLRFALEAIAESGDVRLSYSPDMLPLDTPVSIDVGGVTAQDAANQLLLAFGATTRSTFSGMLVVVPTPIMAAALPQGTNTGTVTGVVTSAESGQPVPGAGVTVQGTQLGTITNNAGRFLLQRVPVGAQTIRASSVGYAPMTRTVDIREGQTLALDFALDVQAIDLEEIIVTGPLLGTEKKKLATPVTILREQEIDRINPVSLTDLFEGNVPGVVSLDLGADADWNQQILVRGVNGFLSSLTGTVKILVDGIETNTRALSAISAQNVERVEVIRGPQASTLYGSEAAGGVIQIFTKKGVGAAGERITASAMYGVTSSPYVEDTPTDYDLAADLSGRMGGGTYNVGASYTSQGAWVPHYDKEMIALSAGFQREMDKFHFALVTRFFHKRFSNPGAAAVWYDAYTAGLLPASYALDTNDYATHRDLTLGVTVTYTPFDWWRSNLSVGNDLMEFRTFTEPSLGPADSTRTTALHEYAFPSVRFSSSVDIPVGESMELRTTGGFDYARRNWLNINATYPYTDEAYVGTSGGSVWEENYTKSGVFGEVQVGVLDRVFLNAGLRADHHSFFGEDFGNWSTNPRVGLSYVAELANGWTLKPRASWGRGINAPTLRMLAGGLPYAEPNPAIGPQTTEGWEAGLDAYLLNDRLYVEATYFSQKTFDAISAVYVTFPYPFQYINAGDISNSGTEFLVRWRLDPVEAQIALATNDNEVLSLPPDFNGADAVGKPVSRPPSPKMTVSGRLSYSLYRLTGRRGDVGFSVNYLGQRWALDWNAFWQARSDGTYTGSQADYTRWFDGFAKAHLFGSLSVTDNLELVLRVDNVFNSLEQETPDYTVPGRQIRLGFRTEF